MHNVVGLVALIAMGGMLVYASVRAARVKCRVARWAGIGLSVVLAVAVYALSVLTIIGLVKTQARHAPVPNMKVAGTPEQIQRGRAIATSG